MGLGSMAPFPGRRVFDLDPARPVHDQLQPGDYYQITNVHYAVKSPDGEVGTVTSPPWQITEHGEVGIERTITVRASIWFSKPRGWHGFLTKGVWQRCDDHVLRARLLRELNRA